MQTRHITLPADFKPTTIRQLLKQWYIPRKWQHFLRIDEQILVNGTYQHFNSRVGPGDQIDMTFDQLEPHQQSYVPSSFDQLTINYEDQDLLIVNKASGIKTHPNQATETQTLVNQAAGYLQQTHQRPYILHQLDMWTSGLIILAKNPLVVPIMNTKLRLKEVVRTYVAVVARNFALPLSGEIDLPIARDPNDRRKRIVSATGLQAITDFKVIEDNHVNQLLELKLQTGRTHQIRVHLASQEVPILGDPLYNPRQTAPRLMLHAYQIQLTLPFSSKVLNLSTPMPAIFEHYMAKN